MSAGYGEFELDIPTIMRATLPAFFDRLVAVPLVPEEVAKIPDGAQGAYCLFLNGALVYVGKTDAQAGFKNRLTRHFHNIQHRQGLDPLAVTFKAVRVFVFSTFDLETMLIEEYTTVLGLRPAWNTSGFGSNDPGRRREDQDPAQFDLQYPVSIDRVVDFLQPGEHEVISVMLRLKQTLPYIFRFETDGAGRAAWRQGHGHMRDVKMMVPSPPPTGRSPR